MSVCVPVYKAEQYIERCARSIFSQDYQDLEIIFVDDCSPDQSAVIVRRVVDSFTERKDQVRIMFHDRNKGVSVARNTFLDNHTGEFVMFVDADDYLMPGAITRLVSRQQQDNSDLVSGSFIMDTGHSDNKKCIYNRESSIEELLQRCCCTSGGHNNIARIYRAKLLNNPSVRFRSGVKIGEDWIFMVEAVLRMQRVSYIDDVVYVYDYTNQGSAMHQVSDYVSMCKWCLADVEALHEILILIKGKEDTYIKGAARQMASRINDGLLLAATVRNKDVFSRLAKRLSDVSSVRYEKAFLMNKLSIHNKTSYGIYVLYLFASRIKQHLTIYRDSSRKL